MMESSNSQRFHMSRVHGSDPEQLSAILSTPTSPIAVEPIRASTIFFDAAFFSVGDLTFGKGSYAGEFSCRRKIPSEKLLIIMPIEGDALVDLRSEYVHSMAGRGIIADGTQNLGMHLLGARKHVTLSVNPSRLSEQLSQSLERTIAGKLDFQSDLDLTTGQGKALMSLVEIACNDLAKEGALTRSPLAFSRLCDTLVSLILEAQPHRFSEELARAAPLPAPRHIKRAIDFMHAQISKSITIADIAAEAGVGVRTLQQGFKQYRQMTPMAYLQELRLIAVHQELMASGPKPMTADVARKWGFFHLGRFAAHYTRRFGQLPSRVHRN